MTSKNRLLFGGENQSETRCNMKYIDGYHLYFRDSFGAISGDMREQGISLDYRDVKSLNEAIKPLGLGQFLLTELEITEEDRKITQAVQSSISAKEMMDKTVEIEKKQMNHGTLQRVKRLFRK